MDFICAMIIACILLFAIDIGTIFDFYRLWIKKGGLSKCFPHWEGTNKHYKWWIMWSTILFTNLIVFIIVTVFCFPFVEGVLFGVLIIYPSITILMGFIYLIVKKYFSVKSLKNTALQNKCSMAKIITGENEMPENVVNFLNSKDSLYEDVWRQLKRVK